MHNLFKKLLFCFSFFLLAFSCESSNKSDSGNFSITKEVNISTVNNLAAPGKFYYLSGQGPTPKPENKIPSFVKFNIRTNEIVTGDDDWDIAFRGLEIAVNGGETPNKEAIDKDGNNLKRTKNVEIATANGSFDSLKLIKIESLNLSRDHKSDFAIKSNWYEYDKQRHIVRPKKGEIFIIKTAGYYYKMEIQSLNSINFDHYTFRYQQGIEEKGTITFNKFLPD